METTMRILPSGEIAFYMAELDMRSGRLLEVECMRLDRDRGHDRILSDDEYLILEHSAAAMTGNAH